MIRIAREIRQFHSQESIQEQIPLLFRLERDQIRLSISEEDLQRQIDQLEIPSVYGSDQVIRPVHRYDGIQW